MARGHITPARLHPLGCTCVQCRPGQPSRLIWITTSILAFGGTLAMTIDLSGYTPTIARLLGMLS